MAYTFLDRGLNPMGVLTNKGGQTNNYWGDQITHSIATGNDVLTSVSLSIDKETTNIDTSGNQKEWNHTIQGLSFGIDGIGREVNELNYLMYKDGEMGRNYLMTITQVDESLTQSGFHFKTIQGINSAAYDLSRKTLRAKEFGIVATGSVTQGTAQNILGYIFDGLGWDVRTIGSFPSVDYSVQDGVTAQSVLQDIIKLFDSSVDAYVLINNLSNGANVFTSGGSIKRVFDFSTDIGHDEGQTIRLNKNLVSLTKTGARDSMYTKLFVSGNGITIGPANNGSDYIVDDDANREYNVLGANSVPVQYLEGAISNSAISDPQALLTWGKKQLAALNHPRFNYVVSSVDGKNVHLGDTVVIQDLKASQPIMLKSKIISKTLSFADPQTDSFVVGEFSPIVITSRNGNTDDIIQMINQANQVASEANEKANQANTVASTAAAKADEANSKVETVFDDAKEYADNLSEKNTELVNSLSSDLQSKSDSLYASQQILASQASSYTNSAVADANAKAVQIGQSAAQNAQSALDEAKKDFTSSIASQASQTASMASEANSKASQYASQAKSEAVSAATSADGVVRTEFKSTTDSMTATIQKNKSDADGKISTAQTTATQALDGLSTKVSQTEYNTKTGQLQTDLTATTQTANQAKMDIVSIKQKDGEQDEKMNSIVSDVNGTKQTVSDLQTVQGKQSGEISTLQQRADGFDATVTKVDNLSVGSRNLLLGTSTSFTGIGNNSTNGNFNDQGGKFYLAGGKKVSDLYNQYGSSQYLTLSFDWEASGDNISGQFNPQWFGTPWLGLGTYGDIKPSNINKSGHYTKTVQLNSGGYSTGEATSVMFRQDNLQGNVTISNLKLESGNVATDWTPAPEDLSSATSKAQLTADNATLAINNYKTDADGRIRKAQADIKVNANAIDTKVAKTDYDKKTGELTTSVNKAQQTADTATQTIGTYKETNDKRVTAAETNIKANADTIKLTVSKTDFDNATGKLSGDISTLQQRANGFDATVTKVDNLSVGSRNYVLGTKNALSWSGTGVNNQASSDSDSTNIYTMNRSVLGHAVMISYDLTIDSNMPSTASIGLQFSSYPNWDQLVISGAHNSGTYKFSSAYSMPNDTKPTQAVRIRGIANGYTGNISISNVKIEIGTLATDWTPAPEDFDTQLAQVKITADGVYSVVSDPTTGLSTRMQKAEGALSTVSGIDIPALKKATFWQPYSSLNFNDYTKQGSFFFNTTATKTNGPTSSNSWIYLIVDQGTSDNSRIKQTAWYDGVDGVKITYARTLNSGTWSPWYANDNDSVTTISQTNGSIQREIADRKTGDSNTLQAGKDFTTSQIKSYDTGMQSRLSQTSDAILAKVGATNLFPNSEFNANYGYRQKDGNTKLSLATKNNIDGAYNGTVSVSSTGPSYQGYWANNIPVQGGQKYSASVKVHYTNGGLANGVAVMDLWFIDSKGARISNASSETSQVSSPFWVRLVSEGFTAPTNAVYLQMSLLVNDAGAGQAATFIQPMLTATEKLQQYTPNNDVSTQLSLLKDNWSIGIADNSGALISGINGDKSGTVISGDKIVLDGKVTVTDDFNASKIITRGLATTNATIEKTLTMGSYGNITASYDKNGSFPTSKNLNVQYILKGGYTFSRDGILLSGKSQRNSDISSSPVVSVGSSGYVLNTWDSNLSLAESNIKISATNTKGYLVNTSVSSSLTSVPDATIDINPYFITMKAQSSQTTISSTAVTSDSINASKSLWSGGDANIAGSLNVNGSISSNTDSVFNKSLEAKGYLTSGQDIRLGWSLTKNGVGIYPSKFNGIPGIHIAGTNSGIVINESANKFYVVMGGHWNEMTMTGNWGTGSWVN